MWKANPGTNFLSYDLGDFSIGVPQALFTAGAKPGSNPQVGGLTAGTGLLVGVLIGGPAGITLGQ